MSFPARNEIYEHTTHRRRFRNANIRLLKSANIVPCYVITEGANRVCTEID